MIPMGASMITARLMEENIKFRTPGEEEKEASQNFLEERRRRRRRLWSDQRLKLSSSVVMLKNYMTTTAARLKLRNKASRGLKLTITEARLLQSSAADGFELFPQYEAEREINLAIRERLIEQGHKEAELDFEWEAQYITEVQTSPPRKERPDSPEAERQKEEGEEEQGNENEDVAEAEQLKAEEERIRQEKAEAKRLKKEKNAKEAELMKNEIERLKAEAEKKKAELKKKQPKPQAEAGDEEDEIPLSQRLTLSKEKSKS